MSIVEFSIFNPKLIFVMRLFLLFPCVLSCSTIVLASLQPGTQFIGRGDVRNGGHYSSGKPSSENSGLIAGTDSATSAWFGAFWDAVSIRQTGGTLHAHASHGNNFTMFGGPKLGLDTIYEVEDGASAPDSYANFIVEGELTMWSKDGGGQQIRMLDGYGQVGELNARSGVDLAQIVIKNGQLVIASVKAAKLKVTMLHSGTGSMVIEDAGGSKLNEMRLNFESGSRAQFSLLRNGDKPTAGYLKFMIKKGWVSIDGQPVTDSDLYHISHDGTASTLALK